ncbi:MAG: hypothetical protein E4H14_17565 [Candidatus Thorarchaeota archaeon]|nr:MAG: hypothetical protein E4H14_17565 [Candidatus Thorarchaeota archaeon]
MPLDVSKVRYISLIRMEGGESVLNIPYAELTVDPDLIAGFVTAVIIFAKTPIRTIRKAAYDILIQVGRSVLVLLVVDPVPDEAPYREKLQRILDEVESLHGEKLRHFEGDVRRFREFALTVIKEFPFQSADLNMVPVMSKNGVRIPFRVGNVDHELEQLESFINGKRTVAEIMDLMSLADEEVLALLSILSRYQWIEFKHRLTDKDILIPGECPSIILDKHRAQYGKALDELLDKFDGKSSIREILDVLPYDRDALWFLINKLVEVGCLKAVH